MRTWFSSFILFVFILSCVPFSVSSPLEARESKTTKKFKKRKSAFSQQKRKRRRAKRRTKRRAKAKPYNPLYAFIVVDAASGKVLSSLNANGKTYPASLTKMMTAYLVFEKLEKGEMTLNQKLKISKHAARQAPGKLWLKAGKTITLKDALYATIVKSANDAAVVLGEAVGGTEAKFAYLMTKKARQLGMYRTFFKNASGLPNRRQVTTARDMMLLSRALYHRFRKYYPIFGQKTFQYGKRKFRSTNKLLGRLKGIDGIKTGYIRLSGFNLSASAVRDGRRIIAVVMGGKTRRWRDQQMTRLINSTFNTIGKSPTPRPLLKPSPPNQDIDIEPHDIVKLLDKSTVQPSHPSEGPRPLPEAKLAKMKDDLMDAELDQIQEEEDLQGTPQDENQERSRLDRNSDDDVELPTLPTVKELQLQKTSDTPLHSSLEAESLQSEGAPPVSTAPPKTSPPKMSKSRPKWTLQVGAYKQARLAYKRTRTIIERYKLPGKTFVIRAGKGRKSVYKAQIKHLTQAQARSACQDMKTKKEDCLVISP